MKSDSLHSDLPLIQRPREKETEKIICRDEESREVLMVSSPF